MKAAPEGVAMIIWGKSSPMFIEESERTARYIEAAVSSLAPERRNRVISACREANVSAAAEHELLWQTVCLLGVESEDRHQVKTPAELDKARANVEHHAMMLSDALHELGMDAISLQAYGREVAKELPELERLMLGESPPTPSRLQIEILVVSMQRLRQTTKENGTGGGRRKVLHLYARIVERIWDAIEGSGLKAGRGGDFERLCDAVFEAAGVPAKAEGAIRYFTKNLLHKEKHKMIELFNEPVLPGKVPD